jgi:hypothetical protein
MIAFRFSSKLLIGSSLNRGRIPIDLSTALGGKTLFGRGSPIKVKRRKETQAISSKGGENFMSHSVL